MFSRDFYPTPSHVAATMATSVDFYNKVVLEPSAGKGDLIDFAYEYGAKEVLFCELNPDLASISSAKGRFISRNFLEVTPEIVSHVDIIFMNPPFSEEEKHISHAWNVAPGGCTIISLCNYEMFDNPFSKPRQDIKRLIREFGSIENVGEAFSTAERKTDVEIGIVRLYKPKSNDDFEFDGYFDMEEEEENHKAGLMTRNEIREVVDRYVGAVKMFDEVMKANMAINSVIAPICKHMSIHFGAFVTDARRSYQFDKASVTREEFKKDLQKSAWKVLFDKFNIQKYVTNSVAEDINKFVEQQTKVPFTMSNIYKMIEMIYGTRESRMNRVLEETFDRICSLSADNSEAGSGWKTNSGYKVNMRFIDTWVCEFDSRWPSHSVKIRVGHRENITDDLIKALCFITGKDYDDVVTPKKLDEDGNVVIGRNGKEERYYNTLYSFCSNNSIPWGEWVVWNDFFKVRGYKKGTMHFEFRDEAVWLEFNRRVAKIKGWPLPQKTDRKKKGTERKTKEGVIPFQDVA